MPNPETTVRELSTSERPVIATVLIATYNRPELLRLALRGYARQSNPDFDVVICDDGSAEATGDLLKSMAPQLPFGLRHVWQEDLGFRKSRILNQGIRTTSAEHLIFADDDCVPHHHFIEGHLRHRETNRLLFGKFVQVREPLLSVITEDMVASGALEKPPFLTPSTRLVLWMDALKFYRQRLLKKPLRPKLYGANFSVDREAIVAVNGLNEAFKGWGYEDNELRIRLVNRGVEMCSVIVAAPCFHLSDGPEGDRDGENKKLFMTLLDSTWAEQGLSRVR